MASTHRAAEGSLGGSVAKTRPQVCAAWKKRGAWGRAGPTAGIPAAGPVGGPDPQASRLGEWRGGGEQRPWS